MSQNDERLTVTVAQAGRLLGISRPTAYMLANQGKLPCLRLGHRLLVPKCQIQRMLENIQQPVQN